MQLIIRILFFSGLRLFFNSTSFAQAEQKEIVITINDFFYEPQPEISDIEYTLRLLRLIGSANDNEVPLHLFIDTTRSSYIQNTISYYLKSSTHRLGNLGDSRTMQLADSLPVQVIPTTYRFNSKRLNTAFTNLNVEEKGAHFEAYLDEYATLLLEDFTLHDDISTAALGKPMKQFLSFDMNDLNAFALPVFFEKLADRGYKFITVEEAFKDSLFQVINNFESPLDSMLRHPASVFSLEDFYRNNPWLEWRTEAIFQSLDDSQRVGQMLVIAAGILGRPDAVVEQLVAQQKVGGVLLLKGSVDDFKKRTKKLDSIALYNSSLPLLYSADAEPSLINTKIAGIQKVMKTNKHKNRAEVDSTTKIISESLKNLNILHNYAPVADMSPNNAAIGNRTFGNDFKIVAEYCNAFIKSSQLMGVAATVKHFPGHGYVKGDSHITLPVIDGELLEAPIYQLFIDSGVVSIMVGHIAVKNNERYNTDGLPASCSKEIISGLLKGEMGFKGLVITDAMRMGGVSSVPDAPLKAVKAGCDMLLMVIDEEDAVASILNEMENSRSFKQQVYQSVKKIIKLKLCLGEIKGTPTFDLSF